MFSTLSHSNRTRQSGFTLIELMVGAVLGMLTVIVIAQVLAHSEGARRTTSAGSDAEVNGSMAIYSIQRDLQMSGYGLASNPAALGCSVAAKYGSASAFNFTLAPVVITDGGGSAADSISVLYGNSSSSSVPIKVTENHTQTQNYLVVDSGLGIQVGDQLVVAPPLIGGANQCTLVAVTNDSSAPGTTLTLTNIPHTSANSWNQSSVHPVIGYPVNSYILNLGAAVQKTYSVSSSYALETTAMTSTGTTTSPTELFPNVVNLQALYGKDTDNNGTVDLIDHRTPTTNTEWTQIRTVMVAIVTRSSQYEKDVVTTASPLWDIGTAVVPTNENTSTCNGSSKCITLDVTSVPDWQHYRYKVYTTTIPLRNILWNS